jgi:hypothetical protein
MPTGLKVVIVINIVATALIGVLAFGIGGGIELAVFPPNLRLESPRLPALASAAVVQSATVHREAVVSGADAYDLGARRWEIRPDGSLQIHDDPRDLAIAVDSALSSGMVPQARTSINRVEELHQ